MVHSEIKDEYGLLGDDYVLHQQNIPHIWIESSKLPGWHDDHNYRIINSKTGEKVMTSYGREPFEYKKS